jgi:hypothetical protein
MALFGELSLEEAIDLSRDRQILDLDSSICLERLRKTAKPVATEIRTGHVTNTNRKRYLLMQLGITSEPRCQR